MLEPIASVRTPDTRRPPAAHPKLWPYPGEAMPIPSPSTESPDNTPLLGTYAPSAQHSPSLVARVWRWLAEKLKPPLPPTLD